MEFYILWHLRCNTFHFDMVKSQRFAYHLWNYVMTLDCCKSKGNELGCLERSWFEWHYNKNIQGDSYSNTCHKYPSFNSNLTRETSTSFSNPCTFTFEMKVYASLHQSKNWWVHPKQKLVLKLSPNFELLGVTNPQIHHDTCSTHANV